MISSSTLGGALGEIIAKIPQRKSTKTPINPPITASLRKGLSSLATAISCTVGLSSLVVPVSITWLCVDVDVGETLFALRCMKESMSLLGNSSIN